MSERPSASRTTSSRSQQQDQENNGNRDGDNNKDGKGKGKGKEREGDREDGTSRQEMKEIKRAAPLPAVKGTIGGIESPRRSHFRSPSTSSFTGRDSPAPGSPSTPTPTNSHPHHHQHQHSSQQLQPINNTPTTNGQHAQLHYLHSQAPPAPDRPVFRADPTMRSCFDGLNLAAEKKDELKRLFGVA